MYCHTCLKCGNHWDAPEKSLKCEKCGAEGKGNIGYQWVDKHEEKQKQVEATAKTEVPVKSKLEQAMEEQKKKDE